MDSAISDDLLGISSSADQHQNENDDNYNDNDQLIQEEQHQQNEDAEQQEQETLQQDHATSVAPTSADAANAPQIPTAPTPQDLVVEQPADPLPLLLIKRELAKALSQLNAKAVEVDQVKQELTLTKGCLAEEKKKCELIVASTTSNAVASSPDAALSVPQQQQAAVALSFKKLEAVFASASSPTSPANPTFAELASKSESLVRENLLLQERVDFLENTSKAFKNQALVWKKVACSRSDKEESATASPAAFHVFDAKLEHQLIAKFPATPEAAKLKQLCAQVTDLLKERAAVAADEGDWRGVVEGLKDGLSSVLAEFETSAKQAVVLRAALHRGASYCIEAANEAQDANAIAADAAIRSQFVSGVLALKGVNNNNFSQNNNNNNNNNNFTFNNAAQDSSVSVLYYRSLLASLIGNASNAISTTSNSATTTITSAPTWQQQQQQQALPPTSELAFLRRLVSEYNAKCNQLEQQNRDYKSIALNCANFFSTTTSTLNNSIEPSNQHQVMSNQKNIDNNNANTSMNKKVLEMWRSSTFELLKIATEMADKASTAPFFHNQPSTANMMLSKDVSYPVLFAKCSALENQVALQNSTIQALNSISQQLSNLASTSSLWLPSVIEACIPSSTTTTHSHNDDDDASHNNNNNNNSQEDVANVVSDIQSLLSFTQEALNDTITNYDDISEDLRTQYETQIQNLEHWYAHRFDAQRLRTSALIQMVRASDAIVAEVCGIEQQTQQNQQFWTKFMSNHNQKFSLLGSKHNPASTSWISAAFGETASKLQNQQQQATSSATSSSSASSSTSTILEQLERSVKSVTQEFKARRAQMEKKLDFFSNSDDVQLQRQILAMQDQIEVAQTNFDKEREEIVSRCDACANDLENKKLECQDWEGKYLELSARYDKMKADAENIMQTLLAEQEKAAKLQQELQEQEEFQQQQQQEQQEQQQGIRHQSIGGASKTSTGGGHFVVEEVVEDEYDDENENSTGENMNEDSAAGAAAAATATEQHAEGEEYSENQHNENDVEQEQQRPLQEDSNGERRKSKSRSKSGGNKQLDQAVEEQHDHNENNGDDDGKEEPGANPFASSLF